LQEIFKTMSNNEKIRLEWNDFETTIRNSFKALREEQDYFDVTLACDDGYMIEAHKIILSAGSEFFRNIFTKMKHKNVFIYLKGISRLNLEYVVDFFYNGEACIAQDELNKFLETARELQVKGLLDNPEDEGNHNQGENIDYEESKDQNNDEDSIHNPGNVTSILDSMETLADSFDYKDVPLITSNDNVNDDDLNQQTMIKKHSKSHRGWKSHICHICNKPSSTKTALKVHIVNYHSQLVFDCDNCGKGGMKKKITYKNHKRTCKI